MFTREAAIAPRRASFFAVRSVFVASLFALTLTAWQMLVGSQRLESIGDLAWFGAAAFRAGGKVRVDYEASLVISRHCIRKLLDLSTRRPGEQAGGAVRVLAQIPNQRCVEQRRDLVSSVQEFVDRYQSPGLVKR